MILNCNCSHCDIGISCNKSNIQVELEKETMERFVGFVSAPSSRWQRFWGTDKTYQVSEEFTALMEYTFIICPICNKRVILKQACKKIIGTPKRTKEIWNHYDR